MKLHEVLGVEPNKVFQCSTSCGRASTIYRHWCIVDSAECFYVLFSTDPSMNDKKLLCTLIDDREIIDDLDYPAFSCYKNFLKNLRGLFSARFFKVEVNPNDFIVYFSKSNPDEAVYDKPSKIYLSFDEYNYNCLWMFFYNHKDLCYADISKEIFLMGG